MQMELSIINIFSQIYIYLSIIYALLFNFRKESGMQQIEF